MNNNKCIINMEFPENCGECLIESFDEDEDGLIVSTCPYLRRIVWDDEKPNDCPLEVWKDYLTQEERENKDMKKLLLIIDPQNDFINGALGTFEANRAIPKIADKVKTWEDDIIVTQDTHYEKSYNETNEGKHLPTIHCVSGSYGWEINPYLKSFLETKKYRHFTKSQFCTRYLIADIAKEYDYIEIVGLCTNICVIVNALVLKTYLPEATICVDAKCCAGTTPELHQKAIDVMRSCQIDIIE